MCWCCPPDPGKMYTVLWATPFSWRCPCEIFRSCDDGGKSPTDLYASLKKFPGKALCIPHHPAADWVHVSAATDWNFNDYEVERLAEIMSRHAPYETDDLWSDYTKNIKKFPRHSVQEALSRGYRMGARLRQRGCNLCG